MFGKQLTLFELFGFKVQIDLSWILLAVLITWSLAEGYFPQTHTGLAKSTYWLMGVAGAIGFFASLILHELSHSLVARREGLPIRGITLFIFGGVAHMEDEPPSARTELLMAIAGPIASILIGAAFYVAYRIGQGLALPEHYLDIPYYLAFINIVLAAFNLIPAFPLDGGRVLRSILWHWKKNLRWATRVASRVGSGFGVALIILGAIAFFLGNLIAGVWWFLIGMFLRGAAQASYRQLVTRQALEGEPISRFMVENPVTVERGTSIRELVQDYMYRYHHDVFPVTDDSRLVGCIGTRQVKQLSHEEWDRHTVGELADPCTEDNTVSPETDAVKALAIMNRTGNSRLMVTQEGRILGIVALKDLLQLLSLKLDLDDLEYHTD
jgi:Zn-dependent protease/CBS domain-containing protein